MQRSIVFYELNEVPFRVLDEFRKWRPESVLGRRLGEFTQYLTRSDDDVPLSPWITWPSLHRGVPFAQHEIQHFGQDTAAVDGRYPPIWSLLRTAGVETGVFGSLHTYPPPPDASDYTFYVPDPFATGPEAHPDTTRAFQEFNLAMSRDSARNVSSRIRWGPAAQMLFRTPQLGIRLRTFADLARQLADERRHPWRRGRRRVYQTVLGFDVFHKLLRTRRPQFCTFFSNHVASAMHRYWAAAFPEDYAEFHYPPEWTERFQDEIEFAMTKFDDEVGALMRFVEAHPEHVLLVASSMGQAATATQVIRTQLYLRDLDRFMARLGLGANDWSRRPAMDPDVNVVVCPEKREAFARALGTIEVNDAPLRFQQKEDGFFNLVVGARNVEDKPPYARMAGERVHYDELGLQFVEIEDQSSDNAYHVPHGILLVYDPQQRRGDAQRREVSTLEIAPFLMRNFGLEPPAYMQSRVAIEPV